MVSFLRLTTDIMPREGVSVHQFGDGFKALSLADHAFCEAAFVPCIDKPDKKIRCKFCIDISPCFAGYLAPKGPTSISRRLGHLAVHYQSLASSDDVEHKRFVLNARLVVGESHLNLPGKGMVHLIRENEIKKRLACPSSSSEHGLTSASSYLSSSTKATEGPLDTHVRTCDNIKKNSLDYLVCNLIYEEGLPLCLVASPAFRELVSALHPDYYAVGIPGRYSIANGCLNTHYETERELANKHLDECEWVIGQIDGWKNEKGEIAFRPYTCGY